jgi:restriction endonuclease S subunit
MKQMGTQGNINTTIVGDNFITIPPRNEQDKIIKILSSFDKKLELLQARRKEFERVKVSLMNALLTGRKRVKLEA